MQYSAKLAIVETFIVDNFVDVEDVVSWLGLTIEDVIRACPDKLVQKYAEIKSPEEDFEENHRNRIVWKDEEEDDY